MGVEVAGRPCKGGLVRGRRLAGSFPSPPVFFFFLFCFSFPFFFLRFQLIVERT